MSDPRLARPSWRGRTNVDALTIAAIERAESIGGHEFVVTQGSYQSGRGDVNSAGTHDMGGVVDLRWCGHIACIKALRQAGFAAWHRTPRQGPWVHHIHAVVIGHPFLAASASTQVVAYKAGRNGLRSNGVDDGPRVAANPPVFPWPVVKNSALARRRKAKRHQALRRALLAEEKAAKKTAAEARKVGRNPLAKRQDKRAAALKRRRLAFRFKK